jgi:hypothetical protein
MQCRRRPRVKPAQTSGCIRALASAEGALAHQANCLQTSAGEQCCQDVHTIPGTVLCMAPASAGQHCVPQSACALCLRLPASMPGSAREEGRGSAQAQDWWRTRCLGGRDCGSASSLPRRQQHTGKWDFPILLCLWLACRRHARSASERCLPTTQAMPLSLPGLPWSETCAADFTLHILGTPGGRAAPGQAQCRCRDQPAPWLAISTTCPGPHILLSSLLSLPQRSHKLPIPTGLQNVQHRSLAIPRSLARQVNRPPSRALMASDRGVASDRCCTLVGGLSLPFKGTRPFLASASSPNNLVRDSVMAQEAT